MALSNMTLFISVPILYIAICGLWNNKQMFILKSVLEEGSVDFDIKKYESIGEIFQEPALKCCLLAVERNVQGAVILRQQQQPATGFPRFCLHGVPLTPFVTESQVGRGLLRPGSPQYL